MATSPLVRQDLVAGLCVAGLLLPEAVAYAGLAHMPVVHALTSTLVGLALYALLGGSRFAIVAPTSSTATLTGAAALSAAGTLAAGDAQMYGEVFTALVLLTGALLLVLALARQGQLSSFISRPVLKGFAFALAISIVIKQLPDAMGLELPAGTGLDPVHVLFWVLEHMSLWHWPSIGVALVAAGLLVVLRRWPQLPASMLVIALAIFCATQLDLRALGVREMGAVSPLHFQPGLPHLPFDVWLRAGELAFGLVMLVFAESWGSMRTMALAKGDVLQADRELLALAVCNVGSGLLQGMVVGAGFSATLANSAAGAVSKRAGLFALASIALALAVAMPLLQYLPRPVLAVAVISALWHALSPKPLIALWRMNRDRLLIVSAALAVLVLGVLDGMLAAVGLSVLAAMQRFSQPVVHALGELGTTRNFIDLQRHPEATCPAGLLILRPEEPLFFGSAERVMAEVMNRVRGQSGVRVVVLSLEESADLDSTAVECLVELRVSLGRLGIKLLLARIKSSVRSLLEAWEPLGIGNPEHMFWSVADAVQFALANAASAGGVASD